jgi:hypothetical protein
MNETGLLMDHRLSEIDDPLLTEIIQELAAMRYVQANPPMILRVFLLQIFHAVSVKKRARITKPELNPAGLLIQKLKGFHGTQIFELCRELIGAEAGSLEEHEGKALYTILNDFGPDLTGKKRRANRITLGDILDASRSSDTAS